MEAIGWEWSWKGTAQETKNAVLDVALRMGLDGLLMPATLFYIFVLPLSRSYFDDGKHYEKHRATWKKVMGGYNWLMAALSFGMFIASAVDIYRTALFSPVCGHLFNQPIYRMAHRVFYFSKFIEYLDTFWLYVMNKPVSWLQWIHHIGAAWLMFCTDTYGSDCSWPFLHFNSFIHTWMYTYYALSLTRTDLRGFLEKIKPVVTISQIIQFIAGLSLLYQYRKIECFVTDGPIMLGVYYHSWIYVGALILLFLNFALQTYVCRRSRKNTNQKVNISPASPFASPLSPLPSSPSTITSPLESPLSPLPSSPSPSPVTNQPKDETTPSENATEASTTSSTTPAETNKIKDGDTAEARWGYRHVAE